MASEVRTRASRRRNGLSVHGSLMAERWVLARSRRLRRKFRFNVADLVVALRCRFGSDPWDFDRDLLRIAARAGPAAGQLANVTVHAFAGVCIANRRVVSIVGGIRRRSS
jgi:hypothetical protein